MGTSRRMVLFSLVLALVAEAGFLANWWIMSSHAAAGPGVATMAWAWPLGWCLLLVSGMLCMQLERRLSRGLDDLEQGRTVSIMLLRLLSPVLMIIGPGIIVFYAMIMVLTAVGVTSAEAVAA